jgi:cell division protein ZipA
MDLRWGLLLVGLAAIALVYRYSRNRPKRVGHRATQSHRKEPGFLGVGNTAESATEKTGSFGAPEPVVTLPADLPDAREEGSSETDTDADTSGAEQPKIVTIRLMSRSRGFPADKLILALREAGLRHGQFGIFHRPDTTDEQRSEFSVANLIEPGAFDLTRIKKDYYPGVSIFMMLPGPDDGVEVFDDMLTTSRSLAEKLDGELFDEQGSTLSIQRERYLREEVVQFQLEHK